MLEGADHLSDYSLEVPSHQSPSSALVPAVPGHHMHTHLPTSSREVCCCAVDESVFAYRGQSKVCQRRPPCDWSALVQAHSLTAGLLGNLLGHESAQVTTPRPHYCPRNMPGPHIHPRDHLQPTHAARHPACGPRLRPRGWSGLCTSSLTCSHQRPDGRKRRPAPPPAGVHSPAARGWRCCHTPAIRRRGR